MGSESELLWVYCLVRSVLASLSMEEADEDCPALYWFGVDGVSVRHAECGCAGVDRLGVDCDTLFFSALSYDVK